MKGLVLYSGIEPVIDDFNVSLSQFTQEAVKERLTDYVDDGIVRKEAGSTFEFAMTPNTLDGTKIDVSLGTAYSSGERIFVGTNILYDPTNPYKTDIASGKPTPQSTGNIAVTLADYTLNTFNYFWIQYLQTIDVTQFAIHPVTSEKFFTRQTDGYWIIVDTTHDPISNPLANSVFLGTVKAAGGAIPIPPVNITTTNRIYALLHYNTVKIHTPKADRSDATITYVADTLYTVDSHIKSMGTGTITATNPHGLTVADLGSGGAEPLNQLYAKETQANKIRPFTITEITGGMYSQVIVVDPGDDFLAIANLTPTESLYVNGQRMVKNDINAGATPINVLFTGQTTNTYFGYLDNTGLVNITSDYQNTIAANGYLPLFSVLWYPADPAGGGGNLRNPDNPTLRTAKDMRVFTGDNNIETRWFDPQSFELFPGRRWLNLTDGQFKAVKDTSGTIVILG